VETHRSEKGKQLFEEDRPREKVIRRKELPKKINHVGGTEGREVSAASQEHSRKKKKPYPNGVNTSHTAV